MRARLSILAALLAAAALAGQAGATTAPGATATIPVTLTSSTIKVAADKFTLKSAPDVARYPRGVTIHFKITNTGSAPVVLKLHLLTKLHVFGSKYLKATESTKLIAPKATVKLTATFAFRGDYRFELVRAGKIVATSAVVVF
ncbi:MAG TPA: hypothetical protein VGG88_12155 [Gaiellaceae bacterium]